MLSYLRNNPPFVEPIASLCVHQSPALDHKVQHINAVHMLTSYFKIHLNIILPNILQFFK